MMAYKYWIDNATTKTTKNNQVRLTANDNELIVYTVYLIKDSMKGLIPLKNQTCKIP